MQKRRLNPTTKNLFITGIGMPMIFPQAVQISAQSADSRDRKQKDTWSQSLFRERSLSQLRVQGVSDCVSEDICRQHQSEHE